MAIDPAWLATTFLVATRLGAIALMTPALGAAAIPPSLRAVLVLGVAAMLASVVPGVSAPPTSAATGEFLAAAMSELALGTAMGIAVAIGFSAFSIGARLLDVQIGFGIGRVFDPITRQRMPVLSGAFGQLALVVFFLSDGHHAVLRGLVLSLERFPPGHPWLLEPAAATLIHQAALAFTLGLALVAPIVLCLLMVELGLGVIARNVPQVNMFTVGLPVKVLVGLAALAAWVGGASSIVARAYASIFDSWEAVLR